MENKLPVFSITVPTCARPGQLATCLQSLARLNYPRHLFEVIVVDDGSEISLEAVVAPFRNHFNLKLLTQSHAGPAAARNTGAAVARGEYLVFTDDDCAPAPDWLQTLAARFAISPDYLIGGRRVNAFPDNPFAMTSHMLTDVACAYYNTDQTGFFSSSNLALPADRFRLIGGFDPTFTTSEDRELCDRWLHHGYRMTYAPEVLVYHAHTLTLCTFWRQRFRFGRGACRFHQARARRSAGSFRPDLTFYVHLLRYPFSQMRGWRALLLTVLLVVAQGANAAGFLWEWWSQTAQKFNSPTRVGQKRVQE